MESLRSDIQTLTLQMVEQSRAQERALENLKDEQDKKMQNVGDVQLQ